MVMKSFIFNPFLIDNQGTQVDKPINNIPNNPRFIHGRLKSYVHARRKLAQSKIQALIEIENKDEEFLDMRNMAEDMPLESASKGDYVLMGWVDKYVTEIEDQGRTIIACINRRLFNMHTLKGKPPNISLWLVDSSIEDVFDHITYGY